MTCGRMTHKLRLLFGTLSVAKAPLVRPCLSSSRLSAGVMVPLTVLCCPGGVGGAEGGDVINESTSPCHGSSTSQLSHLQSSIASGVKM